MRRRECIALLGGRASELLTARMAIPVIGLSPWVARIRCRASLGFLRQPMDRRILKQTRRRSSDHVENANR
jgi:hypothetical protein